MRLVHFRFRAKVHYAELNDTNRATPDPKSPITMTERLVKSPGQVAERPCGSPTKVAKTPVRPPTLVADRLVNSLIVEEPIPQRQKSYSSSQPRSPDSDEFRLRVDHISFTANVEASSRVARPTSHTSDFPRRMRLTFPSHLRAQVSNKRLR